MRRLTAVWPLVLALLIAVAPGCKRKSKTHAAEAEPVTLLSVVSVADPAAAVQLASGFYELEANTWRWTAGKFTVVLRTPEGAAERGARLELHFNLPGVVLDRVGPIAVSAEIAGSMLAPEHYTKPGDYVYVRDVDPALLRGTAVAVHFSTDKALPPTGPDTRELALVAVGAALIAK